MNSGTRGIQICGLRTRLGRVGGFFRLADGDDGMAGGGRCALGEIPNWSFRNACAHSVALRARPEAAGEAQSGLMLRALSCCGNSHSKDRTDTLSVTPAVGQAAS